MANDGIRMPSGSGGLTRFSEDTGSKFQLKPVHVIGLVIATIIVELILAIFVK